MGILSGEIMNREFFSRGILSGRGDFVERGFVAAPFVIGDVTR